ncbi:hypothetical protein CSX12_11035 [Microbacterium sp. Y-01]|nr:hypothetical protein CSX12_11035 [Microbacterium sp. Y-01]
MLDIGELAAYLGVPVSTVYDCRTRGLGPRAYCFGKHLKFALSDVRIWVEHSRSPNSGARLCLSGERAWIRTRSPGENHDRRGRSARPESASPPVAA